MSDATADELSVGAAASANGGRVLSAVLPGLPQLLAGRWGAGAMALLSGSARW